MTTIGEFDIGDRPIITATFADVTGGSGVASAVTFIVRTPAGVETAVDSPNAAIANPSSNVWTYTMATTTAAGRYEIRAKATAGLIAATEANLFIRTSAFSSP